MALAFESQRLPTSKKNDVWRKNQVDAIISRISEFNGDWTRIWQNYRMKNNQVDQEEYREYCDTLGLDKTEGKKFVEPFNKTHNIVEVLKGEEAKMPWAFGVINVAPKATNEMLREREVMYREYVQGVVVTEMEKHMAIAKIQMESQMGEVPPEEAEKAMEGIQAEAEEKLTKILNPKEIENKFINYKSKKEVAVHKLLKSIVVTQNLKWIKNEMFEDAIVAGAEAVMLKVNPHTKIPYVQQLNLLNLAYEKSSDSPFIQDSSYVAYREELTYADILDLYGDVLTDKDIESLNKFSGKVYGTDAKFSSPNGESPSHWDALKKYEYTNQNPYSNIPSFGSTSISADGLYANSNGTGNMETMCIRNTVYWRSQRRIGKVSYVDQYGNNTSTFVSEEFPIPDRAIKSTYKPHSFSKTRTKWTWEDINMGVKELEWIWLPEVWEGIRINGDIYVSIGPFEHAYQSMLDPYKTKLPVHGFVFGNRNAHSVCIFDRIKPWQKLYYIVISKWLSLITQDKGVIQLLNILMMDKDLGYERTMQIAIDQGILPYNPLAHTQGTNVAYSTKASERLDLSNSAQLAHYTNLLEFIESQMKLAAGVSDQRLAQTGSSTNVSDNQRDMAQSMNITNSLFTGHELLWQGILQSICEMAVKGLDSSSGFIRQTLSTEEIALIDLDLISLEDEYAVRIGDNGRAHQTLQEAKGFLQALIQNDKMNFSTLIEMLNSDNLVEFREELRGIEADIEEREAAASEAQQEHEQEMMKLEQEQIAADRKQRMDEIKLKGEYDIMGKQITAMAWDPDKDRDRDGLPDVLEIEQFRNKVFTETEKLNIAKTKLEQEDAKLAHRVAEMENKSTEASSQRSQEVMLERMKASSKLQLEKAKSKNMQTNKKK